jgi:hypothetical protein
LALPDLIGFLSIPGLKPPYGQHWTWWALWSLWAGFWLAMLALAGVIVAEMLIS